MRKILKNLKPTIRSYLGDAFCFSIIDDLAFDTGWVYDKYIHLKYTPDDGQIKYEAYDYYEFVPGEGVFVKSFLEYPQRFCSKDYLCSIIRQMIDDEEYCFALWDEHVITNYLYNEQNEEIYEHGCFIYGYDDETRVFYSQGYFKNEKWEKLCIPYEIFYKAVSYCVEKDEIALIGYKVVRGYPWEFDYKRMKRDLERYTVAEESKFFYQLKKCQYLHYPSLYCMYEHKIIMRKRTEFLVGQGFIKEDGHICDEITEIEKQFRKIMLLGVEYNLRNREYLLESVLLEAEKALERESSFVTRLKQETNN